MPATLIRTDLETLLAAAPKAPAAPQPKPCPTVGCDLSSLLSAPAVAPTAPRPERA